jgi:hypothetical protein
MAASSYHLSAKVQKKTARAASSASNVLIGGGNHMQIRIGYELIYNFPRPTPMILTLSIHYSRASDLIIPDHLTTDPPIPI